MTDHQVIDTMLQLGGSFIQQLAKAYQVAAADNQLRIKNAFDWEWRYYAELARNRRGETGAKVVDVMT